MKASSVQKLNKAIWALACLVAILSLLIAALIVAQSAAKPASKALSKIEESRNRVTGAPERYSDQECSILLGCSRGEVITARTQALRRLSKLDADHVLPFADAALHPVTKTQTL